MYNTIAIDAEALQSPLGMLRMPGELSVIEYVADSAKKGMWREQRSGFGSINGRLTSTDFPLVQILTRIRPGRKTLVEDGCHMCHNC